MRLLLLSTIFPLVLQATPPPVSLEEGHARILEIYDEDPSLHPLPSMPLRAKDRPAQDWLLTALTDRRPRIPFPKGSEAYQEASKFHDLMDAPPGARSTHLKALPLSLVGTQAALWRWGQLLEQKGELPPILRREWEDRLLHRQCAMVIRGWAMRHAFCFALAEADELRFDELKATCVQEVPDLVQQFQRAFALLGGPPPRIYLWSLPNLEPLDQPLGRLASCLRISPLEPGTVPPPEGWAWIVPAMHSNLSTQLSALEGPSLEEAHRIAEGMRSLGRKAYLAPSREPFLDCALAFFPIEIRLNTEGLIHSIRMGDAAQAKPTP